MTGTPVKGQQKTLRAWLSEAPFTLSLSSTFFGFYAHCGVLIALEEAGLDPAKFCGSSAGAIIAALGGIGSKASTEIKEILLSLTKEDLLIPFHKAIGLGLYRLNSTGLEKFVSVKRLEDASRPVAVSTFCVWTGKNVVWTEGDVAQVVSASCAVPLMMQPVPLSDGCRHVDGGVADYFALGSCARRERVLNIAYWAGEVSWPVRRWGLQANAEPLEECVKLRLLGVPRVSPNDLATGAAAMEAARQLMREALDVVGDWGNERVAVVGEAQS